MGKIACIAAAAAAFTALLPGAATAQSNADGWVTVRTGAVVVKHPAGWSARAGAGGLVIVSAPGGVATVTALPFLALGGAGAAHWLQHSAERLSAEYPGARMTRIAAAGGAGTAIGEMTYAAGGRPGRANVLCSVAGRSGMMYAIGADAARFEALKPEMIHVLETLKYESRGGAARTGGSMRRGAAISYRRWADPLKGAFTMEIPHGWKAEGGMMYRNVLDPRASVDMASPDGTALIRFGDASLPGFMPPNALLAGAGFRVGFTYSTGAGVSYVIMPMMSGVDFAKLYLRQRIAAPYSNLQITYAKDRPDLASPLEAMLNRGGGVLARCHVSLGEVAFTCSQGASHLVGDCFMANILLVSGSYQAWAPYPCGYISTPGMAPTCAEALVHIVHTFALNPQWVANNSQMGMRVSRITTETGHEMSDMINRSYWNRQKVIDNVAARRTQEIRGMTTVKDPETGQKYEVSANHNYYWRRGDTIAGSSIDKAPDVDFHALNQG